MYCDLAEEKMLTGEMLADLVAQDSSLVVCLSYFPLL